MKIKRYFFLIFLVLIGFTAFAQSDIPTVEPPNKTWRKLDMKYGIFYINSSVIAGNPYLNKTFQNGTLISKNDLIFPVIPMRYNIYTDNMEYKSPDNKVFALKDQNKIKAYKIGDTTFIYTPYQETKKRITPGYFQILVSGKVTGLLKYTIYLLQAQPERPYKHAVPERYSKISKSFFVMTDDNVAMPISGNRSLLKLFPKQKNLLNQYIKKEKLRIQKQPDFVKLIKYINTLTSSTAGSKK